MSGDGSLADRGCVPCTGRETPLRGRELRELFAHLDDEVWEVVDEHHLEGTYRFEEFADAFAFTKAVGELAEEKWHHPEIRLKWGQVDITLYTYVIDGLFETDFIMAARFDRLYDAIGPGTGSAG